MYKLLLTSIVIALFTSNVHAETKKNKITSPPLPVRSDVLSLADLALKTFKQMEVDTTRAATTLANTTIEWSIRNENINRVQLLNASTTNAEYLKEIQDPNDKDNKLKTGIGIRQFYPRIIENKSNTWICISGSLEIQVIPQWIKTDALTQHPEIVREHISFSDHCLLINGPTEQVISQKIVVGSNTEKEFAVKLRAINPSLGSD
jgi:hypothetical protein